MRDWSISCLEERMEGLVLNFIVKFKHDLFCRLNRPSKDIIIHATRNWIELLMNRFHFEICSTPYHQV